MGAYLPDRFFWARSNDMDDTDGATPPEAVADEPPPAAPGAARH
jgi:hydroxymethylpyrimidine/phosphomethylpyrimidine kinase